MASPVTRVLLVAFAVLQVGLVATAADDGVSWREGIALALIIGAACVVVLRPGSRLPATWAAPAVVALLAAAELVVVQLPIGGWSGYAAWPLGADTFVLLALTLRGRIGSAWVGMAGLFAECLLWSLLTGQGALHGLELVDLQAGTLLLGTLFAIGLTRAAAALERLRAIERDRVDVQRRLRESQRARGAEVAHVLELAGPALASIHAGGRLSAEERGELRALEGQLRDRIVAPHLQDAELVAAVDMARRRGVDVVLLSDGGPDSQSGPDAGALQHALAWLAEQVASVNGPTFIGRIVRRGDLLRASAVMGDHQAERSFPLPSEDRP